MNNCFKLAFKAVKPINNEFLFKTTHNVAINLATRQFKCTNATFKMPIIRGSIQKYNYLNHQRYLSVSARNFNQQEKPVIEEAPPQQKQQQQQQQEKKSSGWGEWLKKNNWKISLTVIGASVFGGLYWAISNWGSDKYDENGMVIRDEFSDMSNPIERYLKRAWYNGWAFYEMWKDPNSDKLLPEPLQDPYYQPPYTLVLEMNGILTHPEWTISNGWRYKKRPGLDYFIDQVKYPMFELVLFADESCVAAAPVVTALDPENKIQFKLFRESTKFKDGVHIKDLSCLNRDVKKIILIDWNENAYKLQPRNALHRLKRYQGEDDDTDLVYLASFLKTIAASGVEDVRDVLDYYNSEVNPLETFKINQVKLKEAEIKRQKELEEYKKKQTNSPFSWARKHV